jgi:hypothetical protein
MRAGDLANAAAVSESTGTPIVDVAIGDSPFMVHVDRRRR